MNQTQEISRIKADREVADRRHVSILDQVRQGRHVIISHVAPRAIVMQKKARRPVQVRDHEETRDAVAAWIATAHPKPEQFLFPSRLSKIAPSFNPLRPDRRLLGRVNWAGPGGIRHPLAEPHESDADLPADQQTEL